MNASNICKVTPLNVFQLLQNGTISCVLSQDWAVNRIVPEFINKENFAITLGNEKKILHLGIGNGECQRYFDKETGCSQFSISDRLYIDPYDIILLYLKRCNLSEYVLPILSEIMRNEYLVSISFNQLYHENKEFFCKKDRYISELLVNEFCQKNTYSYSYNVLLLLIHILNTDPMLLLPDTPTQRLVTPMGKHIIKRKIASYNLLHRKEFDAYISIDDVAEFAIEIFSKINNIYLADFENVKLEPDEQYDYILATRSDAFLRKKYASFVLGLFKHIKKEGFYISDGILASYSYEVFYDELDKMITEIGKDRIFLIKSKNSSRSFPLQEISGIVIAGENANIENTHLFIPEKRLISAHRILNDESFIRQCVWSDLFAWTSSQSIDLENFQFTSINSIINKYVDLKKADQYSNKMFYNEELFNKK